MTHGYKMKDMLCIAGISKQALWKYDQRQEQVKEISGNIVNIMNDIRLRHKRMGCRSMYYVCSQEICIGRDIFERIGFANGFKLKRKPNKQRTTWSQRVRIYPNLIEGKVINGINQIWQSDIFYIKIEGFDYYGISIEDVYSRRLLALHLAADMRALQVAKALTKAIAVRKGMDLTNCIFHSDCGSQYISDQVTQMLASNRMLISMCKLPQENAYVERIQGTLKYQYLFEVDLKIKQLSRQIRKIIGYYNDERPHSELKMIPPVVYEKMLENIPITQRPKLKIYKWSNELLTKSDVVDKKEKRTKKEKSQQQQTNLKID